MSLVIRRLGTANDGCSMMSPAEAKIIVSSPHTRRGWGGNVGSINTDACFNTGVPGQQSDGQQLAGSWKGH